ncbi:MAG: hypothetical protein AAF993_00345 [Pseudomonadota bacterium]
MNKLLHFPLVSLSALPLALPIALLCAVVGTLVCIPRVVAYEPALHQQLTFIAARQYNRCAQDDPGLERLSALDTRYIVKANVAQADANVFVRMFRWNYYNRKDQSNRSTWGVIDTRFHDRFDNFTTAMNSDEERQRKLRNLGRIVNYLQDVTSPAQVVPVYTGRWWRFSLGDRFNRFPVDAQRVEQLIADRCDVLSASAMEYAEILQSTATMTLVAVQSQINDFPTTWEAYWKLAREDDEFGEYGRAGNQFGKRTEFHCGEDQRCLLLENDPLYRDFATARHVAAVFASMQSFHLLQNSAQAPAVADDIPPASIAEPLAERVSPPPAAPEQDEN